MIQGSRPAASKRKITRDGKVAVAISPGFGAGWTTWNNLSPFEPKIIKMIELGKQNEITEEWCEVHLGERFYCGGAKNLEIVWIPKGVKFSINEYDGSESIYRSDELEYEA